jgi:hypothetical protein
MSQNLLVEAYDLAKSIVVSSGFEDEIHWQKNLHFENIDESTFLRESAWVIFCSGFSEKILRKKFPYISICFCDWESAEEIVRRSELCRETALQWFGNKAKIQAILKIASMINRDGFSNVKEEISRDPLRFLRELPFIGEVTCWHLAKNLGIPVAKPDRHLVRIAKAAGFLNVQTICTNISEITGDSVPVVDLILWRYATLEKNYVKQFTF